MVDDRWLKLVDVIKKKSEFSSLDDKYVLGKLKEYFVESDDVLDELTKSNFNERSKEFKGCVKEVRADLRGIYGVFQRKPLHKRYSLLDSYVSNDLDKNVLMKLLSSHQSTFERKEFYENLYTELFSYVGKCESILDVGCGLNPLAYSFLDFSPLYYCSDISSLDVEFLNTFFEQADINGSAFVVDLLDSKSREKLYGLSVDVIFMFKLVDTLEGQERNVSKRIIKKFISKLKPKKIVVSFALKSLGGKGMRKGKVDNWFSRFLDAEGLSYQIIRIENEEFWLF